MVVCVQQVAGGRPRLEAVKAITPIRLRDRNASIRGHQYAGRPKKPDQIWKVLQHMTDNDHVNPADKIGRERSFQRSTMPDGIDLLYDARVNAGSCILRPERLL